MSEEKKDKKKKKAAIIAGIVGSAAIIGGVTGGIIATAETDSETEEKKNKPKNVQNPSVGTPPKNAPSGQSLSQKIDIKNKVKTLWPNVLFDTNKTNQELDSIILNDIHLNDWLQPNLVNPTIKYFSDAQGKNNVSNEKQKAGYLYVVITANDNDPNYQGSTNPIEISLKQYNLNDITQLSGLNLTADWNKKFKDFDHEIWKAEELKINPLEWRYWLILYFQSESDNWPTTINEMKQRKGTFWITIEATSLEPNWYGETPKIKIILK